MRAFICDACKGQYNYYYTKSNGDEVGVDGANAITFVQVDKMNKLSGRGKMELCPNCMEKLQCFIFDELCDDEAPFVGKIRYYQQKRREQNNNSEKSNQ